jgi:hypothetical protein
MYIILGVRTIRYTKPGNGRDTLRLRTEKDPGIVMCRPDLNTIAKRKPDVEFWLLVQQHDAGMTRAGISGAQGS